MGPAPQRLSSRLGDTPALLCPLLRPGRAWGAQTPPHLSIVQQKHFAVDFQGARHEDRKPSVPFKLEPGQKRGRRDGHACVQGVGAPTASAPRRGRASLRGVASLNTVHACADPARGQHPRSARRPRPGLCAGPRAGRTLQSRWWGSWPCPVLRRAGPGRWVPEWTLSPQHSLQVCVPSASVPTGSGTGPVCAQVTMHL